MDNVFESEEFERGFLSMLDQMDPHRRELFLTGIERRLNELETSVSATPMAASEGEQSTPLS